MNIHLVDEIKKNGIVKIENFLDINETEEIKKIIKYYSAKKNSSNSFWPINKKQLILKILKLNFFKYIYGLKFLSLLKTKKMNDFANSFFSNKAYLNFIDAYLSPVSDNNIIPWHTDQAYHGNLNPKIISCHKNFYLKFFIYLTDVSPDNGCMAYIPGSHKIGYSIRKGIYEKKIEYSPYWSLADFRNILKKKKNETYFESYFDKSKNVIKNFLHETKFIENNLDTKKYDYNLKAGSAIIFDEGGIHRGARTLNQERIVLRYLFSQYKN